MRINIVVVFSYRANKPLITKISFVYVKPMLATKSIELGLVLEHEAINHITVCRQRRRLDQGKGVIRFVSNMYEVIGTINR